MYAIRSYYGPKLLISKIKSLLRRKDFYGNSPESHEVSKITIDRERFIVVKDGIEFFLPKKEFEIISLLASKANKVFTREEIYQKIWGENIFVGDRTIDVHIRKIRP